MSSTEHFLEPVLPTRTKSVQPGKGCRSLPVKADSNRPFSIREIEARESHLYRPPDCRLIDVIPVDRPLRNHNRHIAHRDRIERLDKDRTSDLRYSLLLHLNL